MLIFEKRLASARRHKTQARILLLCLAVIFFMFVQTALPKTPRSAFALAASGSPGRGREAIAGVRHAVAAEPLSARSSLDLIRSQNKAGFAMKDLGSRLRATSFEATALDGRVRVVVDGLQQLQRTDVGKGALEAAGDYEKLSEALLSALKAAHDESYSSTKSDVWQLYRRNSALMQAPFTQIGIGNTAEDPWENVVADESSLQMAAELFERFDMDSDGYWNLRETSLAQVATEGTEMAEDAFNALIIASAPNGGRDLTEEELARGLSKAEVIKLYTDGDHQRNLGFVLNVQKDHTEVFKTRDAEDVPTSPLQKPD